MTEKDLPIPKNAKPGDELYEAVGSSSKSQKMLFEPPAELVEIPSHGLLYKNITNDPDVLEKGSIRIRPMTVNEEKILSTPRLVKSGQALDMVFQNCIKSSIDVTNMLSSDRVFLMLWLRSISYGNMYKFTLQCNNPECKKKFEYEVDLSTHPIKEISSEIVEPIEIELPVSKYHVFFRLPRGTDEVELIKLQNQTKKLNEADDSIVKKLVSTVIKITDFDGNPLPENLYEQFISSLVARDASVWRNKIEKMDGGIEDIKGIVCPHCEEEFESAIPITENFFRAEE